MAENKVEQALDTGLNVDPTTYTLYVLKFCD